MANDVLFQHFLRHLFPYFYEKYLKLELDLLYVEPFVRKGPMTKNLFDLITKAMIGVFDILLKAWTECLDTCKEQIAATAETYVSHVIFICYAQKSVIVDTYERLILVSALATLIGIHIYDVTGKKFYKLTPQILTVFFENILKEDFRKRGGWKRLQKYLIREDYLEFYETCYALMNSEEADKFKDKDKLWGFYERRKYLRSQVFNSSELTANLDVSGLTYKVISSTKVSLISELSATTSASMASTSSLQENLISKALSKLSLMENPVSELGNNSNTFEKDNVDVTELYEPDLANHLLNLKRLMASGFSLDIGGSSSDESSNKDLIYLSNGLRLLKLQLERAISLLESSLK